MGWKNETESLPFYQYGSGKFIIILQYLEVSRFDEAHNRERYSSLSTNRFRIVRDDFTLFHVLFNSVTFTTLEINWFRTHLSLSSLSSLLTRFPNFSWTIDKHLVTDTVENISWNWMTHLFAMKCRFQFISFLKFCCFCISWTIQKLNSR